MKGHKPILTMRLAGIKPDCVWLHDYPYPTDWDKWGDMPAVCVAGDSPELLDLRFLKDIELVHIDCENEESNERLFAACSRFAKRTICTVMGRINEYRWEVLSSKDTAGVLTWQK